MLFLYLFRLGTKFEYIIQSIQPTDNLLDNIYLDNISKMKGVLLIDKALLFIYSK